ncbi:PGF-CTERM archaeal protein-sorting signal [Halolamina pelagica]|uniref:PGF-CTERM archaeal protein-sorting signal n=1 Tax=Halolamina pelagica TaxID=699431 RepID=A0A0P7I433_9EURY|nr:PGF-CTERM sorting domain-containing protein [Halolamina pelagica]KPN31734.1 PGF-CTERM archaeal protein-sorting signal [Halolamina pelagica]
MIGGIVARSEVYRVFSIVRARRCTNESTVRGSTEGGGVMSSVDKLGAVWLSLMIVSSIFVGVVAVSGSASAAGNTVQFDFSSAYNADVVYGEDESGDFDGWGALVTNTVAGNNANSGDGLPDDGVFPSTSTHPRIELATTHGNAGNNAWQVSTTNENTFTVSDGQYETVHVIASAGGAGAGSPAKFRAKLHYSDGTSYTSQEFTVPDWYGGPPNNPGYVLKDGMDRWYHEGDPSVYPSYYEDADAPGIWGFAISANSDKTLEKITINVTENEAGSFNFFGGAATAKTSDAVVSPTGTTPKLSTTPITDAQTGDTNEVTVTVTFDEDMTQNTGDVTVTPDVNGDLSTVPTVENKRWTDAQTFKVDVQFVDDNEEVTGVSLEVDGAKDLDGNEMSSSVSTTYDVDTTNPKVSSASISNTPITDGNAGNQQIVTVEFAESMDTSTTPIVEITGVSGGPITVSESSFSDSTWTGAVTIADNDEDVTATIEVSGAADSNGNVMSSPDTSNTFVVSTTNPTGSTPILSPTPITNAETGDGNEVTVTVSFSERMSQNTDDVTVTPDVNGDLSTVPTVENKRWTDAQTFKLDVQFADDNEEVTGVSLEVDGAKDLDGNEMSSAVSTTYDVDTTDPSTGGGGSSISTGFEIDEQDTETATEDGEMQGTITGYKIGDTLSVPTENVDTKTIVVERVNVSFDMGTNIHNDMKVQAGTEPPQGVPEYSDAEQTGYVSVTIDGNLADRVTNGEITVRVPEEQMPDDPSAVDVYHADGETWGQTEKTYLGNDTYRIDTQSFPTFVVVVEDTPEQTTTTTPTTTSTQTSTSTTTPTTTEPVPSIDTATKTTPAPTTTGTSAPGFGIVSALVSLLGGALLLCRR